MAVWSDTGRLIISLYIENFYWTFICWSGTKYQSNLNEIDKGKQKTDEGGGKSHLNWVGGASQVTGELQTKINFNY